MVSQNRNKRSFVVFVNVCRWLLALVLMLSGFLKAVDPVGGMYKLQEYATAFSLTGMSDGWLSAFALVQAAAEFLVGLYLFMGIYRAFIPLMALLAMLLFTPFTLYVWVTGAVSDCGCFGESVVMSNAMTFFKNVVLLVLAIVAFAGRRAFVRCLSSNTRWVLVLFSLVYIFAMQSVALHHLPLIDSGPYAVGSNLRSKVEFVPDEYEYKAVYYNKETGNAEPFIVDADTVMGSEWVLDGYTEVLVAPGTEPEINNFSIVDWEYDVEMADALLADTGYVCIVPIESVEAAAVTHVDKVNDLYDYCLANGLAFCAVSSSYEDELSLWTKRTGAEYPVYWAEAGMLRAMVHANPGLVLLKDGVVVGKWAAADIPVVHGAEDTTVQFSEAVAPEYADVRCWPFWVILLSGVLVVLSLIDVLLVQIARKERGNSSPKETADKTIDDSNTTY
jgi:hypothetical protein